MPKSKARKKRPTNRRRVSVSQPHTIASKVKGHLDAVEYLVSAPTSAPLGLALLGWTGYARDLNIPINSCWQACSYLRSFLASLGFESEILTVMVNVFRGVEFDAATQIDVLGSPNPRLDEGGWGGHTVLWVPDMGTILDPTIGQARFARQSDDWQRPVTFSTLASEHVDEARRSGSGLVLRRQGHLLRYTIHGGDPLQPGGTLPMSEEARLHLRLMGVRASQDANGQLLDWYVETAEFAIDDLPGAQFRSTVRARMAAA